MSRGRLIGGLLLVQLIGLIVPFAMLHPIANRHFLTTAAPAATQVQLGVALLVANCVLTVGLSMLAFPMFGKVSRTWAWSLVAVGALMLVLQAIDGACVLSMLRLSQDHGAEATARSIEATRKAVHYGELASIDAWIFLLYAGLTRYSLVPRPLGWFALATVFLHFFAITLPMILGFSGVTAIGATMALGHIAIAGRLLGWGLRPEVSSPTFAG